LEITIATSENACFFISMMSSHCLSFLNPEDLGNFPIPSLLSFRMTKTYGKEDTDNTLLGRRIPNQGKETGHSAGSRGLVWHFKLRT
jgi:hypothetical protein